MKAYENLAPYYDRFMSFLDYEDEAHRIANFIQESQAKRILDLGAGSGGHLLPLLRQGFAIDALDISQPMLEILQKKLEQQELSANCICGDMCQYYSETPYDLIYAFGDTVHHLPSKDGLLDFLRCSHRNLATGGALVFTWREQEYFEDMAELESFFERHGEDYLLWSVNYEPEAPGAEEATMNYTAFIQGNDGRFDKKEECHRLQVYTGDEIYLASKQIGFDFCEDIADAYFSTEQDIEEYKEIVVLKKI